MPVDLAFVVPAPHPDGADHQVEVAIRARPGRAHRPGHRPPSRPSARSPPPRPVEVAYVARRQHDRGADHISGSPRGNACVDVTGDRGVNLNAYEVGAVGPAVRERDEDPSGEVGINHAGEATRGRLVQRCWPLDRRVDWHDVNGAKRSASDYATASAAVGLLLIDDFAGRGPSLRRSATGAVRPPRERTAQWQP